PDEVAEGQLPARRDGGQLEEGGEHAGSPGVQGFPSFPRSAWERRVATLCVATLTKARRGASRTVRSHAERGNEVRASPGAEGVRGFAAGAGQELVDEFAARGPAVLRRRGQRPLDDRPLPRLQERQVRRRPHVALDERRGRVLVRQLAAAQLHI